MALLYKGFEWAGKAGDSVPPAEMHALMQLIAETQDAWVDHENDPIGKEVFGTLDAIYHSLGKSFDEAVPEAKATRARIDDLRIIARAANRQAPLRKPGLIGSLLRWLKHA